MFVFSLRKSVFPHILSVASQPKHTRTHSRRWAYRYGIKWHIWCTHLVNTSKPIECGHFSFYAARMSRAPHDWLFCKTAPAQRKSQTTYYGLQNAHTTQPNVNFFIQSPQIRHVRRCLARAFRICYDPIAYITHFILPSSAYSVCIYEWHKLCFMLAALLVASRRDPGIWRRRRLCLAAVCVMAQGHHNAHRRVVIARLSHI